jgi:hypothetical protein
MLMKLAVPLGRWFVASILAVTLADFLAVVAASSLPWR